MHGAHRRFPSAPQRLEPCATRSVDEIAGPKKKTPVYKGILVLDIVQIRALLHNVKQKAQKAE